MTAERDDPTTSPAIDSGPTWLPTKERGAWWSRRRTGMTKGETRRDFARCRKHNKRLSAIRRQGKGGGR